MRMSRSMPIFVLMFLAILPGPGGARAEMRTLALEHAAPEELAPVLRETFGSEIKIGTLRNELILRGAAADLAEAEKIVEELDVAREVLRVSVRQVSHRADTGMHIDADGQLPRGGGARRLGNASDTRDQFVHVLAGEQALITVGEEVPYIDEMAILVDRYGGQGFFQSIDFQKVAIGFAVKPMLRNDQVLLEVLPFLRDFDRGDAAIGGAKPVVFQKAMTRLEVPLGQWVDLAGYLQRESEIAKSFVRYGTRTDEARRQIQVKVDKVR